jgi:hypothetical protein
MYDLDQITKTAKGLGITPTNANEGTELYKCWADRVAEAQRINQTGDIKAAIAACEQASAYAV